MVVTWGEGSLVGIWLEGVRRLQYKVSILFCAICRDSDFGEGKVCRVCNTYKSSIIKCMGKIFITLHFYWKTPGTRRRHKLEPTNSTSEYEQRMWQEWKLHHWDLAIVFSAEGLISRVEFVKGNYASTEFWLQGFRNHKVYMIDYCN